MLPPNRQLKKLGEICNFINGKAFKPTERSNQGLPIIRIQNLNNKKAEFNYCNFEVSEKFHIKNNDLLVSWSGTPGTSFGAFMREGGDAVLNQHIFKTEIILNNVDKSFLTKSINNILGEMIGKAHGGAGLKHITKGKLESIQIPLPPLPVQHKIVALLDEASAQITASKSTIQSQLDALDQLWQSSLENTFSTNTFNKKKLSEVCSFKNGFAFKSGDFNDKGIGLQVIRIGNVLDLEKNKVFLEENQIYDEFRLQINDIIIGMTGTRKKRDYLLPGIIANNKFYLNQRVGRLRALNNINYKFLYFFLKTNVFRDKIFLYETGTVNQGNLSGKDIINQEIPLPDLATQTRIVAQLDDLSQHIASLRSQYMTQLQHFDDLRASILDQAFKGELES